MSHKKKKLIKGMSPKLAKNYIQAREKMDQYVDEIYALSSLMSLISDLTKDDCDLEPFAVAVTGKMILKNLVKILESLDDGFVHIGEIEIAFDEYRDENGKVESDDW